MSAEGVVYDLRYTPHEGPRLGRAGAIRAMIADGTRRALGLRRKHLTKVLPWALIGAAIAPAAFFVALTFVAAGFTVEDMGPFGSPWQYFQVIGTLSMLFVALVTPTLLVPDRQYGVLSIYASRPVRAADYLLARAATIAGLTALYMLVPQAILYVGISALNVDGMWAGLVENGKLWPEILWTTLAFVGAWVAPAVLVSLYISRVAIATGVYVVVMLMSAAITDAIPPVSELLIYETLAPLSLFFNPYAVRDWMFDEEQSLTPLVQVGHPEWLGAVMIAGIAVLTGALALHAYRKAL
jgi:ABC-2 type transport system permease protein